MPTRVRLRLSLALSRTLGACALLCASCTGLLNMGSLRQPASSALSLEVTSKDPIVYVDQCAEIRFAPTKKITENKSLSIEKESPDLSSGETDLKDIGAFYKTLSACQNENAAGKTLLLKLYTDALSVEG